MKLVKTLLITSMALGVFGTTPAISQDSVNPNDLLTFIDVHHYEIEGAEKIDVLQAKELFDEGVLFIDPRRQNNRKFGYISGSIHLYIVDDFTKDSLALHADFDDTIVFYAEYLVRNQAAQASAMAVAWGYTDVKYFEGGWDDWIKAGYPIEDDLQ